MADMSKQQRGIHVVTTERKYKDKVYRAHLLRRSYREGGKVKKETVANITCLGDEIVEVIRGMLRGTNYVAPDTLFERVDSKPHGHVQAVMTAMERLGVARLVAARPSRERALVLAMIAQRILAPQSKLAMSRQFASSTLADELGVGEVDEGELYAAMDWLIGRQEAIEKQLAKRHLREGGIALYDLTSSYFEGSKCALAARGHNRDGKHGKLQVNYGLLTDDRGCPVSISVFPGNTNDSKTLMPQVERLRGTFGLKHFVIVGDRGMITGKHIEKLREHDGVDWVTALRSSAIRGLVEGEHIQLDLFDEKNVFEFEHDDYPGERLVACRNPELAKKRVHVRDGLIAATSSALDKLVASTQNGKLAKASKDAIGVAVGRVIDKHKVAKHFIVEIDDGQFSYRVDDGKVRAEAALDGIYVIRTSVQAEVLNTDDTVRTYKRLSQVERAFRSLKTVDLHVRPIRHHVENRVRAHILLCMLSYYVQWHMEQAWKELLFRDENRPIGDPVAPATRSDAAKKKASSKLREDGGGVHSLRTLLTSLAAIVRNKCKRRGAGDDEALVELITTPTADQRRAQELLQKIAA